MMKIDGTTKVYGIIGNPVSHSMSPAMQNAAFAESGVNAVYIPLPVTDLAAGLVGMRGLGLCGASVTIPHKEAVMSQIDHVDPVAARIGAVNTLRVIDSEDGRKIHGMNTDWLGANRALQEHIDLSGKSVVVLGAGGAARAIGFGLLEAGARIVLCSRTEKRGRTLATELNCPWHSLAEADTLRGDILVNATSVGMKPDVDSALVSMDALRFYTIVMDIVYSPLQTRLLADAERAGCIVINGLEMLLYQGVAQFEIWTGRNAPVEVMRNTLLKATGNMP